MRTREDTGSWASLKNHFLPLKGRKDKQCDVVTAIIKQQFVEGSLSFWLGFSTRIKH